MRGDRVAAGMNVNVWDVNEDVQEPIRSGASVKDEALADPDVALGGLAVA
jgi:3-phenylpropionate/trans-cinnamate dioxygenase ferredoxin reductase component